MFQKCPDFFRSVDELKKHEYDDKQTNLRYRGFTQVHFTAGDTQQFQMFRDQTNGSSCVPNIQTNFPVQFNFWDKYSGLNALSVDNTFNYIFNKFKKGIFVKIKNNKLAVFLPFSKHNFVNEWGDRIKAPPQKVRSKIPSQETQDITELLRHINTMTNKHNPGKKYEFRSDRINRDTSGWYANNCLIRYEYPISEGDTSVASMKDMLIELCNLREIPDIEFFVNRRDFPIIKRDGTEAYNHIFDSDKLPLLSHVYASYSPILSMVTAKQYADIPIPTGEDWNRISYPEGKIFDENTYVEDFNFPWEQKQPIAVFRGATTGCGVTPETNVRLRLAKMSHQGLKDADGLPFLDAGITEWNLRARKLQGSQYLRTIEVDTLGIPLVQRMSPDKQSEFKYLINVDGHVSAFRLSRELNMGSVLFIADSPYKMWFHSLLVPYTHYIPVKSDLSDLIDRIRWAKANDAQCKIITENARLFYQTYLKKDGALNYMQKLLVDLKKHMGVYMYNYETPSMFQMIKQFNMMRLDSHVHPETSARQVYAIPSTALPPYSPKNAQPRTAGLLHGLRWIFNLLQHHDLFNDIVNAKTVYIVNKLDTPQGGPEVGSYVKLVNLAGFNIVVKGYNTPNAFTKKTKRKEIINEAFLGTRCLNHVVKLIPNFAYVFGLGHDGVSDTVVSEYLGSGNDFGMKTRSGVGNTMMNYLSGNSFTINGLLSVFIQIAFALQMAQNMVGFVHNDLTPWNILIQEMPKPVQICYLLGERVLRVTTSLVPVIIDYGKSHAIYDGEHYGLINKLSSIQDVVGILLTSLAILVRRQLSSEEQAIVLYLGNFVTGTAYRKEPFKGLGDLKSFLVHATKYDELLYSNKHELEKKSPLDFATWIWKKVKVKVKFDNSFRVDPSQMADFLMERGNARQVFEYILTENPLKRLESFSNVFERFMRSTLPQPKSTLGLYQVAQTLHRNLESVSMEFDAYLSSRHHNKQVSNRFPEVEKFLVEFYSSRIASTKLEEINVVLAPPEFISFNEKTLSLPETVSALLNGKAAVDDVQTEYKNMTLRIFSASGRFKMPDDVKNFYKVNLKKLLETPNFGSVDVKTLRNMARGIYRKNLEMVDIEVLPDNDDDDCSGIMELMKMWSKI